MEMPIILCSGIASRLSSKCPSHMFHDFHSDFHINIPPSSYISFLKYLSLHISSFECPSYALHGCHLVSSSTWPSSMCSGIAPGLPLKWQSSICDRITVLVVAKMPVMICLSIEMPIIICSRIDILFHCRKCHPSYVSSRKCPSSYVLG